MTFDELQNRMVSIGEEFCDVEVDYAKVYDLYLDVLIAIANRQCEGTSAREFAKEAIQMELALQALTRYDADTLQALQDRLAGKPPPPEPEPAPRPPPAKPKKAAKPQARAKGKATDVKPRKRR